MFYSSSYFIYMIPAIVLVMLAQFWVQSAYRRWSRVENSLSISGAQAAQRMLSEGSLYMVSLEGARGQLSDHYDPRSHTLRLSQAVAQGNSVASLAIAAHEIGHALQDKQDYFPLRLRAAIVPVVNIGSSLGYIFILVGLILQGALGAQLASVGLIAFSLGTVFALATVPIEINASTRALKLLKESGLITSQTEQRGVKAVLNAAAFTYIAALAASLLQLLYWASLVMGGRRRR